MAFAHGFCSGALILVALHMSPSPYWAVPVFVVCALHFWYTQLK